jgi:hypothetical protein
MTHEQDLTDLIAIEGDDELGDVEYHVRLQRAINSGLWHLEGNYGRQMMAAIKSGSCMLGLKSHKDCYGNTVPARTDVKTGTAGSYEFVVQTRGLEWAERMASAGETPH